MSVEQGAKMLRVGIVDIDTTHPWLLANYINATGRAQVVLVTDRGETWPSEHLQEFARRLTPLAKVVDSPASLLGEVDAVMFFGTRYDLRLEVIGPFLEHGMPIFLDKPAVGIADDVIVLERYVSSGTRILMGSSVPLCPELKEIWRRMTSGSPAGLVVVGCRSLFEYGIIATDIALQMIQSRPIRVQWGAFGPTECVWAELANGQDILLHLGLPGPEWYAECLTSHGFYSTPLDLGAFRGSHYDLLAKAFVEMAITGRTTLPPQWHLEGIKLLIAAKRSKEEGRPVEIDEVRPSDGFDGREYAENYRAIARHSNSETYLSPPSEILLRDRPVEQSSDLVGSHGGGLPWPISLLKRPARFVLGEKGTRFVRKILKRD